ncbi:MAG TPA: hypothetical protein VGJ94_12560 [Syntrophorhabdaceae bacterium]|jgi:prophage tail gpP-like protein
MKKALVILIALLITVVFVSPGFTQETTTPPSSAPDSVTVPEKAAPEQKAKKTKKKKKTKKMKVKKAKKAKKAPAASTGSPD